MKSLIQHIKESSQDIITESAFAKRSKEEMKYILEAFNAIRSKPDYILDEDGMIGNLLEFRVDILDWPGYDYEDEKEAKENDVDYGYWGDKYDDYADVAQDMYLLFCGFAEIKYNNGKRTWVEK